MPTTLEKFLAAFGFGGSKKPKTTFEQLKTRSSEMDKKLKALKEAGQKLETLGFDATKVKGDYTDLFKAKRETLEGRDIDVTYADLAGLMKQVDEAVEQADTLLKETKKIMGESKGNPSATQKSAIFKEALKVLYKLEIVVPPGMDSTHFDRVFEMFSTVPKEHVVHDKLTKLTYTDAEDDKGSGAYGGAEIEMGDFGDATGKENYSIDGTVIPANSFDVTTLHEIGHAVDAKNSIMASNREKAGCGGWKNESVAGIAAIFLKEMKGEVPFAKKAKDSELLAVVTEVLDKGTGSKPDSITDDEWTNAQRFLVNRCLVIRSNKSPWNNPPPAIGGRIYQQAYARANAWWSYAEAARASTKVNNYQWRAPGEWFAEIYAISWLAKKPPPSGVDASVSKFTWHAKG